MTFSSAGEDMELKITADVIQNGATNLGVRFLKSETWIYHMTHSTPSLSSQEKIKHVPIKRFAQTCSQWF